MITDNNYIKSKRNKLLTIYDDFKIRRYNNAGRTKLFDTVCGYEYLCYIIIILTRDG